MALDKAKIIIQKAYQGKFKFTEIPSGGDLTSKFSSLYYNSVAKCPPSFRPANLLRTFVNIYEPNRLVLELYSKQLGYSLFYKEAHSEIRLIGTFNYEDDEILKYVDSKQIMPCLIPGCISPLKLLYNWCIIVEIRDFRSSSLHYCEPRYSLLKPTTESMIQIANFYCADQQELTVDDINAREAFLLLRSSPPLCLDPDPLVTFVSNSLQHSNNLFPLWTDQKTSRRRRLLERIASVPEPGAKKQKRGSGTEFEDKKFWLPKQVNTDSTAKPILAMNEIANIIAMNVPICNESSSMYVEKEYSKLHKKKIVQDRYVLELLSEEFPSNKVILQSARIDITKFPIEEQYYGKLAVKYLGDSERSSSEILLGSKAKVEAFVNKFVEVFTEEDTKIVRKLHEVPGSFVTTTYTEKGIEAIHRNREEMEGANPYFV